MKPWTVFMSFIIWMIRYVTNSISQSKRGGDVWGYEDSIVHVCVSLWLCWLSNLTAGWSACKTEAAAAKTRSEWACSCRWLQHGGRCKWCTHLHVRIGSLCKHCDVKGVLNSGFALEQEGFHIHSKTWHWALWRDLSHAGQSRFMNVLLLLTCNLMCSCEQLHLF